MNIKQAKIEVRKIGGRTGYYSLHQEGSHNFLTMIKVYHHLDEDRDLLCYYLRQYVNRSMQESTCDGLINIILNYEARIS